MLNNNKKYKKIKEMLKEGKGYNEISEECKVSCSTIKKVHDAMKRKEYHHQVKSMIEKGKTCEEISVELDLDLPQVKDMVSRYITTKFGAWLGSFYLGIVNSNIDPEKFLILCRYLSEKNIGIKEIEELISINENIGAAKKKCNQLLDFSNTLRQQTSSMDKEISEKDMIISEKEMIIQDMDKTIKSKKTIVDQLDMEINRKQAILDTVNELDNKIKKDPSYIKIRKQFLEKLSSDNSVFSIADGMVEILYKILHSTSLSFREQNRYYNISQIPNFETFRKVLTQFYKDMLSAMYQIIIRHIEVEKRFFEVS